MRWGVPLPLVDLGDGTPTVGGLRDYVGVARELGYDAVGANDHLGWRRPGLDGGVRRVLLWSVGDVVAQLRRFAAQVAPHVDG